MKSARFLSSVFLIVSLLLLGSGAALSQTQAVEPFTIEQVLSYAFCYDLVSAKKADRVAWLAFEEGRRNVYAAAAPDFRPVRLTSFTRDDGTDLQSLRISDDGAVVVFVRGHDPNREGWVANPSHYPDGSEQAIWAVHTRKGTPTRLAQGDDPVLSPNGDIVLFVKDGEIYGVSVPAQRKKKSEIQVSASKPLFRTWGTNRDPQWSPDGKKIAFVSDREDHSFIGLYDVASRRITYLAPSVDRDTSPTWSGDGTKIAFIRRPGSAFSQITAASQARQAQRQAQFRFPTTTRRATTDEEALRPQPAAGPGFQQARFADGHVLTFFVADVARGEAEKVWHDPLDDRTFLSIREIMWAGDSLVFRLERDNWQHYFSIPASGPADSTPTNLTPGEGEAEFIGYSADGHTLYYSTNVGDIDRRDLWATPTSGGEARQVTSGNGIETEPAPLASGSHVAVFYSDAKHPRSVALVPAEGGEARVISSALPAGFPREAHVVPEQIILKAEDGLEFHNQLFVPDDIEPGERRPAILFSHGGPRRQMLLGYHYMYFYHMAYAINQYFANQGYVVISVNFRSGIGYGARFRNAPERGSRGSSEYQDIVAAARYLQSRPDVDPERIGLWGLSYGGLITALGLSRNSDIFKAGVDIAGVHLWGNSIDVNSTSFQASPISTVDKWTSPVLLVHGDDDRNVEFSQTTGLVQLLRARNVRHELIIFPDEVHDFLVHSKWVKVFNAADDFFKRFLKK